MQSGLSCFCAQCAGFKNKDNRGLIHRYATSGQFTREDLKAFFREFGLFPFIHCAFEDPDFEVFVRNGSLFHLLAGDILHQVCMCASLCCQ